MVNASSSGYYDWLKSGPSKRSIKNKPLDMLIEKVFNQHEKLYGYRRVYRELLEEGLFFGSRERIRAIGLAALHKHKFKQTTHSDHDKPVAPNLLNQDFNVCEPNVAWAGDITYVRMGQKWLYLAVIIDLYSRQVISWSMDKR